MMPEDMATKSNVAERTRAASERGTLVFLFTIPAMFLIGLLLHGRIFPFELSEPLVGLAAIANLGAGAPWLLARMLEAGAGVVTASSYEHGNCFLIVSGLLNSL